MHNERHNQEEQGITRRRVFLRSAYNYDMNAASLESGLNCQDATLTQQHFKEETDINTIVRRFKITGEIPQNIRMPTFQDFTGVWDFQSAMNAVRQAQEAFDAMPADVRTRFHNDPQEFVEFTNHKDNLAEARKLGLVPPEELPEPPGKPMRVSLHMEDGTALHEPLRDSEGRYREHTRAEKRAENKSQPKD